VQNDPATQRRGSTALINRSSHPPSVSRGSPAGKRLSGVEDELQPPGIE
jgi:hypothetical protein